MTVFLTFAFRSKCRVNKTTSCKKKKTRRPIIGPAIAVWLLITDKRRVNRSQTTGERKASSAAGELGWGEGMSTRGKSGMLSLAALT